MTKKFYLVLDTETVADARVPYDIAWILIDRQGEVVERFNALTAEVLDSPTMRYVLEHDNFAKRKAGFYLTNTPAQVMPFDDICTYTNAVIATFDAVVVAYNARFDRNALNNYSQAVLGKKFISDAVTVWDLWTMALYTVCASRNYARYCDENGKVNERGNRQSTAEAVYGYMVNNGAFVEEHTALADAEIEAEILFNIFKRKQKLNTDMCGCCASREPWKRYLKR